MAQEIPLNVNISGAGKNKGGNGVGSAIPRRANRGNTNFKK